MSSEDVKKRHHLKIEVIAENCEGEPYDPIPMLERAISLLRSSKTTTHLSALAGKDGWLWFSTNCPLVVPGD
jgi:hypothetical protein